MMQTNKSPKKEEIAWALDYLPYGKSDDSRPIYQRKPLIQAIGESQFVLMELIPKDDMVPDISERLYIGEGDREKIDHVKGRLHYTELSNSSHLELPAVIEEIILSDEARFIKVFNDAYPISTRLHMLELLPGIGKKLMWGILDERKKGMFKDFADLQERVKGLHKPENIIARRIIDELMDNAIKYRIFTTPPRQAAPSKSQPPQRHRR